MSFRICVRVTALNSFVDPSFPLSNDHRRTFHWHHKRSLPASGFAFTEHPQGPADRPRPYTIPLNSGWNRERQHHPQPVTVINTAHRNVETRSWRHRRRQHDRRTLLRMGSISSRLEPPCPRQRLRGRTWRGSRSAWPATHQTDETRQTATCTNISIGVRSSLVRLAPSVWASPVFSDDPRVFG